MSFKDTLNKIEINQEGWKDPKNTLSIDGKDIKGVRNVKIEYGIDFGIPVVTIEFYAKVKGKLKKALKITRERKPPTELPYVFHKTRGIGRKPKKKKGAILKEPYIIHERKQL